MIKVVVKHMIDSNIRGHVVFVGSVLSMMSFNGYAQYAPAKFALRGLAETLRNELLPFGIKVSLFLPATIKTPGYAQENLTKPEVTKKIEGIDPAQSSEVCAMKLLQGLKKGQFMITNEIIGEILRCSSRGASPLNNPLIDSIYVSIAWALILPRSV